MAPEDLGDDLSHVVRRIEPDHAAALTYYPEPARAGAMTLMAFAAELRGLPSRVTDPMLGAIRQQWWRDALAEVFSDARPRAHPLVTALTTHLRDKPSLREEMERMIDATSQFLQTPPQPDLNAALKAASAHDGGLARLLSLWVGETPSDAVGRLGAIYGVARVHFLHHPVTGSQDIAPPAQRIAWLSGGRGAKDQLGDGFDDVWASLTPFAPALAPVLAPLNQTRAYLKGKPPSALSRQARQFATVLRGK